MTIYKNRLKIAGNYKYVTSTRVKQPTKERTYYHLVYATRHLKGLIEFRNVEKISANIQEQIRDAGKQALQIEKRKMDTGMDDLLGVTEQDGNSLLFAKERSIRISQAKNTVAKILYPESTIPIESLQGAVLEIPLVWPSDLDEWVLSLRRSGAVTIRGMSDRAKVLKRGQLISVNSAISPDQF